MMGYKSTDRVDLVWTETTPESLYCRRVYRCQLIDRYGEEYWRWFDRVEAIPSALPVRDRWQVGRNLGLVRSPFYRWGIGAIMMLVVFWCLSLITTALFVIPLGLTWFLADRLWAWDRAWHDERGKSEYQIQCIVYGLINRDVQ